MSENSSLTGVERSSSMKEEHHQTVFEFLKHVLVCGINRYRALNVKLRESENLFLQLMEIEQQFEPQYLLDPPMIETLTGARAIEQCLYQALRRLAGTPSLYTLESDNNLEKTAVFAELIFMFNGFVIRKGDNSTVWSLGIKMNDHIIALNPFQLGKDFDYSSHSHAALKLTLMVLEHVENLMFAANVILKANLEVKHLKQRLEKHLKVGLQTFALVHNGIILSDRDTLAGAGVSQNDKIVLIHVELEVKNPHLERLLIVNAACSGEVTSNHEPAVGEPFGMRIMHNLDPNNLSGHKSKRSAEVCKSLLDCTRSKLMMDLMSHFNNNNEEISKIEILIQHFRLIFKGGYAHASELLYDLYEALISFKPKFYNKNVWKETIQMVTDFYDKSDQVFKTTCGRYCEPLKRDSFFSYENLPKFAIIPKDKTFIETVLYVGPLRDGTPRHNLPMVKLKGITYTTTIQDVINSYTFYANLISQNITGMTMTFNDKTVNPKDSVSDVLGGLFEKNYIMISDVTHADSECLDDILQFIEGKKDEKASRTKKKDKKPTNNSDVDEPPLHQTLEQKPPKDIEKAKIAGHEADENNSTTSNKTDLVNERMLNHAKVIEANSKQHLKQNLSAELYKVEDPMGIRFNTIEAQTKVEEKAVHEPNATIINCEEKTLISGHCVTALGEENKVNKHAEFVESQGTFKGSNLLATNLKENNDESRMLEVILKNETDLLKETRSNLENMIGVKSKEMKDLLVEISLVEDQNIVNAKKKTSIDVEIEDLEARVAKLKAEKLLIENDKDLAKVTVHKLNNKKARLETYIEAEMERTQSKENEIKRKIKDTKEKIKTLEIPDTKAAFCETPEQNSENYAKQKLLDFLTNSIKEKENDLECPVCLEIATIPIYSCQESHLICAVCRPKVVECPECRIEYRDNGVMRRHRYAEKTANELERLKEERNTIL